MPLPLTGVTEGRSGMLKCFKFEQQKLQTPQQYQEFLKRTTRIDFLKVQRSQVISDNI
jgi:hypothetical protein